MRNLTLFESERLTLAKSIEIAAETLQKNGLKILYSLSQLRFTT